MSDRRLASLVGLSAALCAISIVIAVNAATPERPSFVPISVATLAALLGVGLYAWRREGQSRFGQALFAAGICWFFVTFSAADTSLLYSIGRIAGWVFEVAIIYTLLAYPTGRLETRGARAVVITAVIVAGLLYLPTIPLLEQYPLPAPFTDCVKHCPPNYFLNGTEPHFVSTVIAPIRDWLTLAAYLGAVFVLVARLREAGSALRRTLAPVLVAAIGRFVATIVFVALRRAGADGWVLEAAVLVALVTVPLTALGFLVGLVRWRVYSAGALGRLLMGMADTRDPAQLRDLLAGSLQEPDTRLYIEEPTASAAGAALWTDSSGASFTAPPVPTGTCVREAEADSGLRVALVADQGFRDRPEFLDAVCACVVSGLERQRLDAALAASLADVAASRKRLVGAADGARQKIERDLHDGAQQQLVALRVKLELAREALEAESADGAAMVGGLGVEVEQIIEEVRSLARGIYPALLASDGLGEALRAAGQRSPVPVTIEADGVGRLPAETESAVYFCCLEALQNVAKHAAGATNVKIALLDVDDELRFEFSDDGCGFTPGNTNGGSGMTGMRDRIAAVGGELRIESARGEGTRILGRVALD